MIFTLWLLSGFASGLFWKYRAAGESKLIRLQGLTLLTFFGPFTFVIGWALLSKGKPSSIQVRKTEFVKMPSSWWVRVQGWGVARQNGRYRRLKP